MSSIRAAFGLDTRDFRTKLKGAERSINRFRSLVGAIGLGAGAFQIVRWFGSVIDNARNATGELNDNTAAVKRFAEGIDSAKTGAMDLGTAVIGSLNRIGESIGGVINSIRGVEEVSAEVAKKAADDAVQAEERLAEARKRHEKASDNAIKLQLENQKLMESMRRDELSDSRKLTEATMRRAAAEEELRNLEKTTRATTGVGRERVAELQREILESTREEGQLRESIANKIQAAEEEVLAVKEQQALEALDSAEKLEALEERRAKLVAEISNTTVGSAEKLIETKQKEVELERLNLEIQQAKRNETERIAREQSQIDSITKRIADRQAEFSRRNLESTELITDLERDRNDLAMERDGLDDPRERLLVEERIAGIDQRILRVQEDITRERQAQRQEVEAAARAERLAAMELKDSIAASRRERSQATLQQVASGELGDRGQQRDAQRALELERRATEQRLRGREEEAERLLDDAAKLRERIGEGLRDQDRDPEGIFKNALKGTEERLQDVVDTLNDIKNEPQN